MYDDMQLKEIKNKYLDLQNNEVVKLVEQIEKLTAYNYNLNFLDSWQQTTIDTLNAEVARLRMSINILEDEKKRNLAFQINS